ncbi:hypothetical protein LFM09_22410 [Lentzea alba]|uniref:hypothetical protein n=1 Tax=Lentzea alba TaxID=2714351 RepID=UPI0039BED511
MKRAAEVGEVLDLRRRGDNVLRATAIRDLLRSGDLDPRGIRVVGARVTGRLDLIDIQMPTSLELDNCVFEESPVLLDTELRSLTFDESTLPSIDAAGLRARYFGMRNARCTEGVNLDNAFIDGPLLLHGSNVGSMYARGLRVSRTVSAGRLFATQVQLEGCEIGGDLQLTQAVIVNESESALILNNAKVIGDIYLNQSFVKAGGEGCGMLMLDATAGALFMRETVVRSATHSAVGLDGSQFRADVRLDEGFDARSWGSDFGTIQMVNARVGGNMFISGSVRNDEGIAVIVQKSTISATLGLAGTAIQATTSRPAVEMDDNVVGGNLVLRPEKLVNHGRGYDLSLSNTKVGDLLRLDVPTLLENETFTVTVNGLTYPEPPRDTDAWLRMLRDRAFSYYAQPYQQLAAVHRAAGHEHTARKVLIAQQRDLRRRGDPGNKLWHWFLGVTLGYGYKPSRAVAGLLATFVLALCLVWTTNAYNGLSPAKDRPADSCSPVNRISLAADLAIPLVKLGGTPRCELANGPAGQWATGAGWVVQILGWSFATLSVAGFTGLVRKS